MHPHCKQMLLLFIFGAAVGANFILFWSKSIQHGRNSKPSLRRSSYESAKTDTNQKSNRKFSTPSLSPEKSSTPSLSPQKFSTPTLPPQKLLTLNSTSWKFSTFSSSPPKLDSPFYKHKCPALYGRVALLHLYPGGRTPYESLDAMCEQKYAGKGS